MVMFKNGEITLDSIPKPQLKANHVVVRTMYSAISPGTEMMLQNQKPEVPIALGYSAMGVVEEVGDGVQGCCIGQRVACYGAPYVRHAERILVPKLLVQPIDEQVESKEAAFVGLGAIAIHALRQASLPFGETVAVVGLGILGQLVCQIAHQAGYRVIAYDRIPERVAKLRLMGCGTACDDLESFEGRVKEASDSYGADAVMLCASSTDGGLIDQALAWVRDRGKVVIVGDMKPSFDRQRMFMKESQVLISRAGGPGRYDPVYEAGGVDYPYGYVRWTEGRNMNEFIRLLRERRVHISPLISAMVPFRRIHEAYERYRQAPHENLGVVVDYGCDYDQK